MKSSSRSRSSSVRSSKAKSTVSLLPGRRPGRSGPGQVRTGPDRGPAGPTRCQRPYCWVVTLPLGRRGCHDLVRPRRGGCDETTVRPVRGARHTTGPAVRCAGGGRPARGHRLRAHHRGPGARPARTAPRRRRAPSPATPSPTRAASSPARRTAAPFAPLTDAAGRPLSRVLTGIVRGAAYRIEVPLRWNGQLALYAHGYRGTGTTVYVDSPRCAATRSSTASPGRRPATRRTATTSGRASGTRTR